MWSVVRSLGDPARRSPLATPAGGGSVSEAAGDAFREPAPLVSSVSGHVVTSGALVALPTSRGALVLSPGSGRGAAGRVATPRSWPRATQLPCCVFLPGASARRTARPRSGRRHGVALCSPREPREAAPPPRRPAGRARAFSLARFRGFVLSTRSARAVRALGPWARDAGLRAGPSAPGRGQALRSRALCFPPS